MLEAKHNVSGDQIKEIPTFPPDLSTSHNSRRIHRSAMDSPLEGTSDEELWYFFVVGRNKHQGGKFI